MKIGADVRIDKDTLVKLPDYLSIGNHVAIDKGFYCTTRLTIGNYVHISPYVTIIGGAKGICRIGDFTTISAGARIICVSDSFDGSGLVGPLIPKQYRNREIGNSVDILDFANVCTNAVITAGIRVGEGAVVGANSFVNENIPDWEIWAGSPAKFIRKRNRDIMLSFARKLGYQDE